MLGIQCCAMEDNIKYPVHKKSTLLVIGGGAAGFFTAVNAARLAPALQVIIAERSNKVLSKVKISGGGRCNVTHACFDKTQLSNFYPRGRNFVKKAFHQFFTTDTVQWFEERGVQLKTEDDGRMFPVTDNSETIIQCLLREASKYQVELRLRHEVKQLKRENNVWQVFFTHGTMLKANYVCIATGGFPKLDQYAWITGIGHSIVPPVPSLFTFNMPGNSITQLMGVAVSSVTVKIRGTKLQQSGPLLITHWGLSGPAVLKLSAWGATTLHDMHYAFEVLINWLGNGNEEEVRRQLQAQRQLHGAQKIINGNLYSLPARLWAYLIKEAGINENIRWADMTSKAVNKLTQLLCAHILKVSGKTTFKEEFVTAGGVTLSEIDPQTMGSKIQPDLYFAGEIMDVDGVTGGFNFQHAWTSGFIAAKAISASCQTV